MDTINLYDDFMNEWSEKYFSIKYKYICSCDPNSYDILMAQLSRDPNITLNIVKNHPEAKWNHEELNLNPNITLNMIRKETNIIWDENLFSANPNVTIETIRNNPDIDWDYYIFSSNENVTWEIVQKNSDIAWDYHGLSSNPNITPKTVGDDLNVIVRFNYESFISNDKIINFKTNKLKREIINIMIRSKLQEWFKESELKQELLAYVWRPENIKQFRYLDSEQFGKGFDW